MGNGPIYVHEREPEVPGNISTLVIVNAWEPQKAHVSLKQQLFYLASWRQNFALRGPSV